MEPQDPNVTQAPAQTPPPDAPASPSPVQAQPVVSQPQAAAPVSTPKPLNERAERFKKLSIQIMIGGLVGAAVIAVTAVLAGSFNGTFMRALVTLLLVMFHALTSLAFIEQTAKKSSSFRFFENCVFFIIVLSFFTSIFGVWSLLSGSLVLKLYGTYLVLLFASLHGQMLSQTTGKQANIDNLVNVNYLLMGSVVLLLLPIIWTPDSDFPGFYYRVLAALGIVDATLTILTVILHRMYIQKHPEQQSTIFTVTAGVGSDGNPAPVQATARERHIHPLVWLLGILIAGQLIISVLFAALGAFYRH